VKAIAEMHRGTVSAHSERGINTFAFSVAVSQIDRGAQTMRPGVGVTVEADGYSSLAKGKSA
jgi:two-component system heavy metal sensor histidine kinase CusS